MILCDSNIIIDMYKGRAEIVAAIEHIGVDGICISDVTRAELLLGTRNKREMQILRKELAMLPVLPILPDISGAAINLLIHFRLSHGLDFMDALHAATALHHGLEFYTLNVKDFIFIPGIVLYRPQDSR